MKTRILTLALFLFFSVTQTFGQASEWSCDLSLDTGASSEAVLPPGNICGSTIDYAPDSAFVSHTPTKTIRLVWHFMQDDNGLGNFDDINITDPTHNAHSAFMIKVLNGLKDRYQNLKLETRQDPNHPTPLIKDSRIRFELSQSHIFYHKNTVAMNDPDGWRNHYQTYVTNNSNMAHKSDAMHVFWYPHRYGNGTSWASFGDNKLVQNGVFDDAFPGDQWYLPRNSISHEIGHCLGLWHTNRQPWGTCSSTLDDGCDDTPPAGSLNPCPCWNGKASEHGHVGDDDPCSTNMMTYNAQEWSLTRGQLGRMHYFLVNDPEVNGCWINDYCTYNSSETITISNGLNRTWKNTRYLKGDLIIEQNATLTIKCYISLPQGAQVVVKPGGKLILDGGTLSNNCGQTWSGVRVEGVSNLNQLNNNQGRIELINNAKIEHALNAISLSGLNSSGSIDFSKFGGIVKSTNSNFINNARDIEFFSYHNKIGNNEVNNLSSFVNTNFITNSEMRFLSIGTHVTMWDVNGVSFSGCEFKDDRIGVVPSIDGRTGIFTIAANYSIQNHCPFPYQFPPCTTNPSSFHRLKQAVESHGGGTKGNIQISRSDFSSHNGVLLNGINNPMIRQNTFTIEHDPLVNNSTDYPYGLYLDECQSFNTEGNTFTGTTGLANINYGGAAGLVVRNSGANNNEFYRSNFEDLKVASQALSENREIGLSLGLRFRCNEYEDNYDDLDVRNDFNNPYSVYGQLGMAEFQGFTLGSGASLPANLFGNASLILNNNIDNIGNWINYGYSGLTNATNFLYPVATSTNVAPINLTANYSCPNRLNSWGFDRENNKAQLIVLDAVMMVQNIQFENLEDNGNTSQLLTDINSATSSNVITVYNNLLNYSPYLSYEVLAQIAEKGSPFTNTMIKDVLVKNPHSARSTWVKNQLDTRINPLSQSERNEINLLVDSFTSRDTLGSELALNLRNYDLHLNELIQSYLLDSIIEIDTLAQFLTHPINPTYHYELAEMYFDNGDWSSYLNVVNNIPVQLNLSSSELQDHTSFTTLFNQLHVWKEQGTNLYEPNTMIKDWLQSFLISNPKPPVKVYPLLAVNGIIVKEADVYIPNPSTAPNQTDVEKVLSDKSENNVKIYPNPGSNYLFMEWKGEFKTSKVQVYSKLGKLIINKDWSSGKTLTLNTKSWSSGVYIIQIDNNGKKDSHKVIIKN